VRGCGSLLLGIALLIGGLAVLFVLSFVA